jgi:chorismate synthase
VVVDGCPAGLPLTSEEVQAELDRRRPGQSILTTPRQEEDRVEILSGLFEGHTLGTPIGMLVRNKDARPSSYADFKEIYRPSHADYTYQAKYGLRNWMGGGRASARETIARVAGGAVALKLLNSWVPGLRVTAWVESVHQVRMPEVDPTGVTREQVEAHPTRCPHPATAEAMFEAVGVPPGWGEPVFNKLEAELAKAMLSLPAAKGFEVGSGFAGTLLRGSEHNDAFVMREGEVRTASNRSGGIQGGISNGEAIVMRVAFKPTATIGKAQATVDQQGQERELAARGRHDPCVLPRAVPIVEAMTSLVLADALLLQRARAAGGP